MSRSSKKIHLAGGGHGARPRAAFSLVDLLPATLLHEPPPEPRYVVVRQLTGKYQRINLDSLRLNVYRPGR